MAQSQDGRDTVQEWVHKQKKETKKRKGKKTKEKELGLGLPVTKSEIAVNLFISRGAAHSRRVLVGSRAERAAP